MSRSTDPRPLMTPIYESTVCPWTPENPRHDHQLIFHLEEETLLLVWSEYYASAPSHVQRTPFDTEHGFADAATCRLTAKLSWDAGRSWSPRYTIQDNKWGMNVKHPNLVRISDTDILFTFTAWESESTGRNVYMRKSNDNGETWGAIDRIGEPGWYCTNNDHALRLSSGRIILPSHGGPGFEYRGKGSRLYSFMFISDDEGRTWHMSKDSFTVDGRGAHEPSLVELSDGRLLCYMRTTQKRIYWNESHDQGEHWSEPQPTDLAAPDSPPLLKKLPGTNDLLLIWNNVASESNWPRIPLTCAVSTDEGRSWSAFKDIDNREQHDAAYAAVTFHNGEALVTYYTRPTYWARDTEVNLKVFKISQLYG